MCGFTSDDILDLAYISISAESLEARTLAQRLKCCSPERRSSLPIGDHRIILIDSFSLWHESVTMSLQETSDGEEHALFSLMILSTIEGLIREIVSVHTSELILR